MMRAGLLNKILVTRSMGVPCLALEIIPHPVLILLAFVPESPRWLIHKDLKKVVNSILRNKRIGYGKT